MCLIILITIVKLSSTCNTGQFSYLSPLNVKTTTIMQQSLCLLNLSESTKITLISASSRTLLGLLQNMYAVCIPAQKWVTPFQRFDFCACLVHLVSLCTVVYFDWRVHRIELLFIILIMFLTSSNCGISSFVNGI